MKCKSIFYMDGNVVPLRYWNDGILECWNVWTLRRVAMRAYDLYSIFDIRYSIFLERISDTEINRKIIPPCKRFVSYQPFGKVGQLRIAEFNAQV